MSAFTDRIDAALADGPISFLRLAEILYPDRGSKSWRYQINGGPPGCFITLSASLRRGGYEIIRTRGSYAPADRMVHPKRLVVDIVEKPKNKNA